MPTYKGGCTCGQCRYTLHLTNSSHARTTLCHCPSCKKAYGGTSSLTAKVSISSYHLTSGRPKVFIGGNGLHREFCRDCGTALVEYGELAKEEWRYVVVGTLDWEGWEALSRPKVEFFCRYRAAWSSKVPGALQRQEVKE